MWENQRRASLVMDYLITVLQLGIDLSMRELSELQQMNPEQFNEGGH